MKVIIAGSRKIGRYTDWELVKLVADAVVRSGLDRCARASDDDTPNSRATIR